MPRPTLLGLFKRLPTGDLVAAGASAGIACSPERAICPTKALAVEALTPVVKLLPNSYHPWSRCRPGPVIDSRPVAEHLLVRRASSISKSFAWLRSSCLQLPGFCLSPASRKRKLGERCHTWYLVNSIDEASVLLHLIVFIAHSSPLWLQAPPLLGLGDAPRTRSGIWGTTSAAQSEMLSSISQGSRRETDALHGMAASAPCHWQYLPCRQSICCTDHAAVSHRRQMYVHNV